MPVKQQKGNNSPLRGSGENRDHVRLPGGNLPARDGKTFLYGALLEQGRRISPFGRNRRNNEVGCVAHDSCVGVQVLILFRFTLCP